MRSSGGSRDPQQVQTARRSSDGGGSGIAADLPLLPLFDHVLLPGGFLRVTVPASWRKSSALVELLLQQQAGEVLVAAVPYLTAGSSGGGGAGAGRGAATAAGVGASEEDAAADNHLDLDRLHHTGTAARVLQLVRRTQSGGWTVTLEGRCRVRVRGVHLSRRPQEVYEAAVEQLDYFAGGGRASSSSGGGGASKEQEELSLELLKGTRRLFLLIQGEGQGREVAARVARALQQQGPARMSDVLGSLVARSLHDRLALLSALSVTARLQMVVELLNQMLEVAEKAAAGGSGGLVRSGTRRGGGGRGAGIAARPLRMPDFGGGGGFGAEEEEGEDEEDGKQEVAAIMQKLKAANPPAEVLRAAQREFRRLQRGSDQHPGYSMSLSYLETLADLPWSRHSAQQQQQQQQGAAGGGADTSGQEQQQQQGATRGALPLGAVRQRLDEAHYGLDKIKERIVQYVAVQRLRGWDARAPILCFIGPPGVGKTSLARSIAEVLGRPFQRISLGGVRDEAEIRGHRRTYIGAMPGRLIQAVRKAGVRDPLLLLDEVDKMGRDAVRGDPAAALLEVLDPEQNAAFVDTYLGLPWDLSPALFVATANRAADIPPPLLDRLEVVQLGGYTLEEKVHIAERHLIPRLLSEHGLHQGQLIFPPGAVRSIIEGYTGEAGVRHLARCLAAICRHVAVQVVQQQEQEQEEPGSSAAALLGGMAGSEHGGGGGGGGIRQPPEPPLPVVEDAASRAAPAAPLTASHLSLPTAASFGSSHGAVNASNRTGGSSGLQLQQQGAAGGASGSMRLWAQLAPLAAGGGGGGASSAHQLAAAIGGYPWRQLSEPVVHKGSSSGSSGSSSGGSTTAAGASDCGCSPRKQHGWFSWLPWMRHDGSSTGEQHEERASAAAAAAGCSCPGGCGTDPDCCCSIGQGDSAGPAGSGWAEQVGAPGMAADSASWESSWRQSAAAADAAPLLCGPGSMQVLRPAAGTAAQFATPASRAAAPAGRAPLSLPALAPLLSSSLSQQQQQQQQAALPAVLSWGELQEEGGSLEQQQQQQQADQQALQQQQVVVDEALIAAVLGPRRYEAHSTAERVASPGTAAGLVWTSVGGKVQYIECICVGAGRSGSPGQLTLTGQLGDVLEESARIALSWVRAHAGALGLPGGAACPSRKWDVHIHLPAGAVPKDGPSAGITLAAALVSLFTGKCARADTAMTGELTLRGLVLPVGGVKEKLLAAHAAGLTRVLLPARNMPDVEADVPADVRRALEVVPCHRLEDVLAAAFDPAIELQPQPLLSRL